MYARFGRRITRGYVLLACTLILVVVAATSILAFWLYARTLDDSLASAAARGADVARQGELAHKTLHQIAPGIVATLGRGRLRVTVYDNAHAVVAQSASSQGGGASALATIVSLLGIKHQHLNVQGGSISIAPDTGKFGALLGWYWSFALPVGAVAILFAWLIGRAITRRAVAPLEEVTTALNRIAAGGERPELLAGSSYDLAPLTGAYNDLAFRLNAAAAERAENETRMRQFVADAGHELRTPLTVIMGYLDALQRGIVSEPGATSSIYGTMLDESRRMRALIEKLIFLARLDRERPAGRADFDLAASTRRTVAALAPIAGERIRLTAPEHAPAAGERDEIEEALRNVIENALKYAPGSQIRVQLSHRGGMHVIVVDDDGPGIAGEDLPHVFDRFYRGAARYDAGGSGLGLAIAKRAIERSGGSIMIESPGVGTRVTLTLPVADHPDHPADDPAAAEPTSR